MTKPPLTLEVLLDEAAAFAEVESKYDEPSLYGVTDGKRIGTYLEHKFQDRLAARYRYERGSSAKGIDLPELDIDIKTTSIAQPQSSCPFKSARQKIYGLGYSLLATALGGMLFPHTATGSLIQRNGTGALACRCNLEKRSATCLRKVALQRQQYSQSKGRQRPPKPPSKRPARRP